MTNQSAAINSEMQVPVPNNHKSAGAESTIAPGLIQINSGLSWLNQKCLKALLLLLLVSLPVSASSLRIFTLNADEWEQPRSGAVIVEFGVLRAAVNYWEKGLDSGILIRYPGEDSGEIWATELRDWLVSLGIPSDYIQLVSGSQAGDEIKLIVGTRADLKQ